VTLKIPGNITGGNVGSGLELTTSMGNEAALIKNGALTINGSSNSSSPTAAMTSGGYSAVTGVTTLTGEVAAGTLAKGTVITWNGLTELANTAVKRAIAGSTCTVADDKVGPSVTIDANIGGEAGAFFLTTSEAIGYGTLDATDITITAAASNAANCRNNVTVTASDAVANRYKVTAFEDCNEDGLVDAAEASVALSKIEGTKTFTMEAAHNWVVGDKVVCTGIAETDDNGTWYVKTTPAGGTTATFSATGPNGTFAEKTDFTNVAANAAGDCVKQADSGIALANADSIVVKTASSPTQACTTVASVANSKVVTVTDATGLAAGDLISVSGLTASAENGTYYIASVAGAALTLLRPAGNFTAQAANAGAHNVVCEGQSGVKDASDNFGTTTTTRTLATLQHTDSVKPILTAKTTCVQHTNAVISDGTYLSATSNPAAGGPLGVAGNAWRMSIVNKRGLIVPTVAVDNTAMTITVTADLAYASAEDIQAAYANSGGAAWTLARVNQAANAAMGTASATLVAAKSTDSGTGDQAGVQRCTVKVTSNENIQALAANDVSAAVAINGVAQAWNGGDATFDASVKDRSVSSTAYYSPALPVVEGTVTTTLTGTIKDTAGNTVTVLALQD
jgi:hypothetical protein